MSQVLLWTQTAKFAYVGMTAQWRICLGAATGVNIAAPSPSLPVASPLIRVLCGSWTLMQTCHQTCKRSELIEWTWI
jgi:hypothetical protein